MDSPLHPLKLIFHHQKNLINSSYGDIFEITGSPYEFVWNTQVVAGIGTEAVDTVLFHQDSAIAIFQDIEASQVTVNYIPIEQIDI